MDLAGVPGRALRTHQAAARGEAHRGVVDDAGRGPRRPAQARPDVYGAEEERRTAGVGFCLIFLPILFRTTTTPSLPEK